jgi:ribonuclease D
MLIQLRWAMEELLREKGKLEWALEEFEAVRTAEPAPPRQDPWRRTSGINKVKGRRQLTALRGLWEERERLAQHKDVAPGRLLPDAALVAAAAAMPRTVPQLLDTPGFHGRLAAREAPRWLRAIAEARTATELVPFTVKSDALPPVKAWEVKRPEAAARLRVLKPLVAELAEAHELPTENLLTPEHLRRFCWQPPKSTTDQAVADRLRDLGARRWQVELTAPVLGPAWRELRARKRAARQVERDQPPVGDEDEPAA